MDCLFCEIARKEKTANILYEDDAIVAFLDVFPCAEGHTLVIPKRHMATMLEMREDEIKAFWFSAGKVLSLLKERLSPQGFTIGINHDKVAGQAIEHLHLHLIPRYEGDGGGSIHSVVKQQKQRSVEDILARIVNH